MKPLIICYYDSNSKTPGSSLHRYVERNLDAELALVTSWSDLVLAVTRSPSAIVFHNKMVDSDDGCKQILDQIKRICIRLPYKINVGVYVDYENSPELITDLQSEGVVGLVPNPEHFGIDSSVEALRSIMNGKPHWPSDVIACLAQPKQKPKKTKITPVVDEVLDPIEVAEVVQVTTKAEDNTTRLPNVVYFRFNHYNSPKCTEELIKKVNCTWAMPDTWQQLTHELESGERTVASHIDMIDQAGTSVVEFVDMIQMMVKFMSNGDKLKIGVVITKNTNLKVVTELQQTAVTGLLLDINEFPLAEVTTALSALIAGKQYWPEHIISQLPGNKTGPARNSGILLTERQKQIANLICKRGLSNKKVASMLTITESTVKAHVSAILKAYGVRNRTQLVLSVNK